MIFIRVWDDGAWGGARFLTKEVKRWVLDAMLGFAAGVMIAASYFSLLAPSVELGEAMGDSGLDPDGRRIPWRRHLLTHRRPVRPHLHTRSPMQEAEGIKTS